MTAEAVNCMTCGQTYLVASGPPSSGYEAERAVEWLAAHTCVPKPVVSCEIAFEPGVWVDVSEYVAKP